MSREKPQVGTLHQHPDEFQQDLNPNAMKGQNIGVGEAQESKNARTAYDHKEIHDRLQAITDDNLKQIRVLEAGTRLQQGATYVDLNDLDTGEFTATGDTETTSETLIVPKKEVPYHLWNLLIGVENPARLADASDQGVGIPSNTDDELTR
jgi:hypothetical protein